MLKRKNEMSFFNFSDQLKDISEKALLKCGEKWVDTEEMRITGTDSS